MDYSPKVMKEVLDQNHFNFKKNFGQNFIVDENTIKNIVDAADIDEDTMVIEIGPGAGSLTFYLARASKNVLCYEIDDRLSPILQENLDGTSNVEIIFGDFLKANVKKDLQKYDYKKLYVVANLPYYITTPIIVKMIEEEIGADKIVVMVQKEVGDRFKAKPGTKDYGSLSVFINYYYHVKKLLDVSKNVFMPKPKVDSIVVEFTKRKDLFNVCDVELFFKLVRSSFTQKRKTLRNNLKEYDLDKIEKVLNQHGMDLSVRAEQIPIGVFVEIANALIEK